MAQDDWTDEELRAAVDAYLEMLQQQRAGGTFVKKHYYRELSKKFGRTEKAFEYRAQNISHVLALLGRDWLPGLVPAKNVGTNVVAKLEKIIAEAEGTTSTGEAAFENTTHVSVKKSEKAKPAGTTKPETEWTYTKTYKRDPEVKAWVLRKANGACESCSAEAPFITHDDVPFLEVHHVRHLGDGGSDTIGNAAALCPNCHRALHYSRDKAERVNALYKGISRLVRE